jgi:hypothetical protein
MYYKAGDIDVNSELMSIPHLGKMTIDHYASVIQMEAYVIAEGFKARSNHTGGVDLEFEKTYADGYTGVYGAEYEEARSHTKEDLNRKWGLLLAYDVGKIFCGGTDLKVISSGMPPNSVESRGQNFVKWIKELKQRPAPVGLSEPENEPKKDDCENIKTDDIDDLDVLTSEEEIKDLDEPETDVKVEIQPAIAGQEASEAL